MVRESRLERSEDVVAVEADDGVRFGVNMPDFVGIAAMAVVWFGWMSSPEFWD